MNLQEFHMNDFIINLDLNEEVIQSISKIPSSGGVLDAHFPGFSILPGIYILEVMAQASGYYLLASQAFSQLPFLVSVENSKFIKFVKPEETLTIISRCMKSRRNISIFEACVYKDESLVASATIKMGCMPFPVASIRTLMMERAIKIGMDASYLVASEAAAI